MRELAVYYCLKCGRYGYYQSSKNATCPICNEPMKLLDMTYQDFMNLDCEERDHLFSHLILESCPTYVQQLMAPHHAANHRETIARMSQKIIELETDNQKLNDTLKWMHNTIWDLLKENKQLKKELEK